MAIADNENAVLKDQPSQAEVDAVIRTHTAYGAAGGFIPLPFVDMLVAGTVQLRMISNLCDLYRIDFSDQVVKSTVSAIVASALPRTGAGYAALSATKAIPVFGPVLGMATFPALYGAVTWALGKAFAWHFANGGTMENLSPSKLSEKFRSEFQKVRNKKSDADEVMDGDAAAT